MRVLACGYIKNEKKTKKLTNEFQFSHNNI